MSEEKKKLPRIVESKNSTLTALKKLQLSKTVRDMILEGSPRSEIFEKIKTDYELKTDHEATLAYDLAVKHYQTRALSSVDLQGTINLHIGLYEKIYQYFNEIDNKPLKTRVLQAKEKLLGFHRENTIFEVNQDNVTIVENQERYNYGKLSKDETKRLSDLLKKAQ